MVRKLGSSKFTQICLLPGLSQPGIGILETGMEKLFESRIPNSQKEYGFMIGEWRDSYDKAGNP